MKTYLYRDFRIDVHPYAGGFKSFIFPPGGNGSGVAVAVVAAPDGQETVALEHVLRDSKALIHDLMVRPAA